MGRKLFFILILVFAGQKIVAQTTPGVTAGTASIGLKLILQVPTLNSIADADSLKTILINFNSDKITGANYNLTNHTFTIHRTDQFNDVEVLAIFREFGYEAYYIDGAYVYRLNGTESGLITVPYNPSEE